MAILEEISRKLANEDQDLRTYRRAFGFGENLKNDILPLLINVKDPGELGCGIMPQWKYYKANGIFTDKIHHS